MGVEKAKLVLAMSSYFQGSHVLKNLPLSEDLRGHDLEGNIIWRDCVTITSMIFHNVARWDMEVLYLCFWSYFWKNYWQSVPQHMGEWVNWDYDSSMSFMEQASLWPYGLQEYRPAVLHSTLSYSYPAPPVTTHTAQACAICWGYSTSGVQPATVELDFVSMRVVWQVCEYFQYT